MDWKQLLPSLVGAGIGAIAIFLVTRFNNRNSRRQFLLTKKLDLLRDYTKASQTTATEIRFAANNLSGVVLQFSHGTLDADRTQKLQKEGLASLDNALVALRKGLIEMNSLMVEANVVFGERFERCFENDILPKRKRGPVTSPQELLITTAENAADMLITAEKVESLSKEIVDQMFSKMSKALKPYRN
jgi:hypothetical protein